MKKIACFIFSYEITRGMKSIGPKGLLKSKRSKELINYQIDSMKDRHIDIYVILGFGIDKIKKKIEHQNVSIIDNNLYESANHGYALELILDNYDPNKYDGCIIMGSGILCHSDIKTNILSGAKNQPILYYSNNSNTTSFPIGFTIIDSVVQHMFFNLSENIWNEILYLDNKSLNKYKNIYDKNMRNMFLFEIINKSIDQGIMHYPIKVKTNKIIKISSIKDANKIKEPA